MIYIPDRPYEKRNLKKFSFSGEALKWFFTKGIHVYKLYEDGDDNYIPEDATFVYAYVNPFDESISLIFEHSSFPEVYENQVCEEGRISITTGIGVLSEAVKEKSFELEVYKRTYDEN